MLSRRRFILGSAAALGSAAVGRARAGSVRSGTKELVVGGFQTRAITGQRAFALVAIEPAGSVAVRIPLSFHMHGFAPEPEAPRRAVLFEKKGPGACQVDLIDGKVLRAIAPTPGYAFYGHGAYATDGRLLYATESRADGGIISVRDGHSLEPVGQFPTFGAEPHDCHLAEGGRVLVITNGGGSLEEESSPPCVSYVDVRSHKLVERVVLDNPRWNTGHVARTRTGDLAVVSAPRKGLPETEPGGVSLRRASEAGRAGLVTMKQPAEIVGRLKGETLSVCVHEPTRVVAATTPDANLVTFWHLGRRAFVASLELEHPRGVVLVEGGRFFAVSCGVEPRLIFVSTETLKIDERRTVLNAPLSSSHLVRHRW